MSKKKNKEKKSNKKSSKFLMTSSILAATLTKKYLTKKYMSLKHKKYKPDDIYYVFNEKGEIEGIDINDKCCINISLPSNYRLIVNNIAIDAPLTISENDTDVYKKIAYRIKFDLFIDEVKTLIDFNEEHPKEPKSEIFNKVDHLIYVIDTVNTENNPLSIYDAINLNSAYIVDKNGKYLTEFVIK